MAATAAFTFSIVQMPNPFCSTDGLLKITYRSIGFGVLQLQLQRSCTESWALDGKGQQMAVKDGIVSMLLKLAKPLDLLEFVQK